LFTFCPPAPPARYVYLQFVVAHRDLDLFHIRDDIDKDERCVAAVRRIERRQADQAMDSPFPFQVAVGVWTVDDHRRALDPGFLAGGEVDDLGGKAAAFGPAGVHAQEHLRPVL